MPKNKLTPAQARVMRWLSQGWGARVSHGSAVEINGERVCNVDTMYALEKMGLVVRGEPDKTWKTSEAGRKLKPEL